MAIRSEYTRVIHPNDYDSEKGRFKSISFKPSSDGGISVFKTECGIRSNGTICSHIARYYDARTGNPAIYWEIPSTDIPSECQFKQTPSSTGDGCHLDILGWTEKESGRYIGACMICAPTGTRPLRKEDLEKEA